MRFRLLALLLIPGLVFPMGGCSAGRQLSLPGAIDDPEQEPVEEGRRVNVYLLDGAVVTGEVRSVTPDTLVVVEEGNYGREEHRLATAAIDRVEVEKPTGFTKAVIALTVAVSVVVLALVVVVGASVGETDLS